MCGIAGFTKPDGEAKSILAAMTGSLQHRGPDDTGMFVDVRLALGHTRLAIIDLAGGAQPRIDEATGDALVFNGEIYGYRALADELRAAGVPLRDRSDTEVLFQMIRRDGVRRTLERIDGMFAFAYRDGASGTIHLVRDRFGEKPLYYGVANGALAFASEATALRRHPAFADVAPDRMAAYRLLLFEYLPGEDSGWDGIAKLEPATCLSFKDGAISKERYWQPQIDGDAGARIGEDEAAERLGELLSVAVKQRLVADVPVGVFLSGGVDSSLITALAAKVAPNVTAFTIRFADESFDETPHAREVARHLDVRHEIVEVTNSDLIDAFDAVSQRLGEPLADSSLLPTYLVCRAARKVMTVALGGDGADELFAGYPNFGVQRFAPAMRCVPPALGAMLADGLALLPRRDGYMNWRFLFDQLSQGLGAPTSRQSYLWMAPFSPRRMAGLWRKNALPDDVETTAFAPVDRIAESCGDLGGIERLLHLFLVTYLPEDILTKTDRASMFNSLEVRAPYLDRAFAEYACALPTRLKLDGRTKKRILKRIAGDVLPAHIVHRKKHGFAVPIGTVMRTLVWERCRDVLLSRANPIADWFERAAIEDLLAQHASGRHDHGKKLWALYTLFSVAAQRGGPFLPAAPPRVASMA